MMKAQVGIGPEFFQNIKRDYSNWKWGIIREFMQNSIDAGSTRIDVSVEENFSEAPSDVILTVKNNGYPMDHETLVNKLLCLGGSAKNFEGTVGGFGVAKSLLYFCHKSYEIRSGSWCVRGSGAEYDIEETDEHYHGTTSRVTIHDERGTLGALLRSNLRTFAAYAQWRGTLVLNDDEVLETDLRKGARRRDLGFGVVYTNRSHENLLVVRIHGIPMFIRGCGHDRCVVLELSGDGSDVLTSNRDGLVHPYSGNLSDFITELSVDKKSALKDRGPVYEHFAGSKYCYEREKTEREDSGIQAIVGLSELAESPPADEVLENDEPFLIDQEGYGEPGEARALVRAASSRVSVGQDFVIKNETGLRVPEFYTPTAFSAYSWKLMRVWGRLLFELHRLFDVEAVFTIGFLFHEDEEAQYEDGPYGPAYYINPVEVVEQRSSFSKSFRKRFKLTERNRLLFIAAHEFVHGALGHRYHDEIYANVLTNVAVKIADNRSAFTKCFN